MRAFVFHVWLPLLGSVPAIIDSRQWLNLHTKNSMYCHCVTFYKATLVWIVLGDENRHFLINFCKYVLVVCFMMLH